MVCTPSPCFTQFCFNAPCQLHHLLSLLSFGSMPFGWLSITLSSYFMNRTRTGILFLIILHNKWKANIPGSNCRKIFAEFKNLLIFFMHAVLICINPKYMNSAIFLKDLLVMIFSCILLMRHEHILFWGGGFTSRPTSLLN